MAGFVERVLIEVEARTKGAANDLRAMGGEVKQTEGLVGKLKATAGGLGSTLGGLVSGPTAAVAGITAIGAAAAKTVGEFTDLALAAGHMADATGLSAEQSSRLIEVFGDVGVEAENTTGLVQKFVTNLGKNREEFAALGVTATDSMTAFEQAIGVLNRTPEGAERAAAGMKLFGKSWADAAELAAGGVADLDAALAGVSDAKVIDQSEVDAARDYRDSMDALNDSLEDVSLTLGESLVPAVAAAAAGLASLVSSEPVRQALEIIASGAMAAGEALQNLGDWNGPDPKALSGTEDLALILKGMQDTGAPDLSTFLANQAALNKGNEEGQRRLEDSAAAAINYRDGMNAAAQAEAEWRAEQDANAEALRNRQRVADELTKASQRHTQAVKDEIDAERDFRSEMDQAAGGIFDHQRKIRDAAKATDDWGKALEAAGKKGGITADELPALEQAIDDVATSALNVDGNVDDALASLKTLATANLPPDLQQYIAARIADLERLKAQAASTVIQFERLATVNRGRFQATMSGGPIFDDGTRLVGEAGPELVHLPRGARVDNADATRRGASAAPSRTVEHRTYNVTLNVPVGAQAADVGRVLVDAIGAFERANGSSWRKP